MSKHHRHYKHLHIPETWEQYWSKYPNGYTMLESLIDWVSQVNKMISSFNNLSDEYTTLNRNMRALEKELRASWKGYKEHTNKTYEDFRDEILTIVNQWIATIEPTIQDEVVNSLTTWLDDGTLADIINEDVFDMKANQTDLEQTLFIVTPETSQTEIQNTLDQYKHVRFTAGDYPVNLVDGGSYVFDVKSHSNISFDSGARIVLENSNVAHYQVFQIRQRENIIIDGATIVGDRETNTISSGEWGMGIEIVASHNIEIRNAHVSNCWGDGLYIGSQADGAGGRDYPSNIRVYDSIFDNNRRQGTSIISGKNLRFERCEFTNTQGTLPESGIDIEPNHQESIEKIDIIDCVFKGNGTYSITTKVDYDSSLKYLTVRGCQLLDERHPNMRLHGSGTGVMSDVVIENNTFDKRFNMGSDGTDPITIERVRFLNNVVPNLIVRHTNDFVIARNTLGGKPSGGLPSSAISITDDISLGKITDNVLEQLGSGILTSETATTSRIHVTNNNFVNTRSGNAMTLNPTSRDWVITGNTFYDISDNGVEVDGSRNNVSNNTFVTVRGGRAIKLNEGSRQNNVNNNITVDISSFNSNPILDDGSDNIVDVLP